VIGSLIIIISIPYKWLKTRLLLKEGMLFYIVLFVLLMMLVVFFIRILVYHLIIVSSIFQRVVLFLKTRSVVKSYVIILLYDPVLVIIKVLVLIGDEIIMIDINIQSYVYPILFKFIITLFFNRRRRVLWEFISIFIFY
jgi:hypothetical protein